MKNFNFKKFLSLFIVSILSLGVFCFAGCNSSKPVEDKTFELNTDNFVLKNTVSEGIKLTNFSVTLVEDEDSTYLEETIIATVSADVGADTTLKWSAHWQDTNVTKDVNEFLTIHKVTTSGHEVKVRCHKNFENYGAIVLVVKASTDSTISATCVCNYVGYPTDFAVYNPYNPDWDWSLPTYNEEAPFGGIAAITTTSAGFLFNLDLNHGLEVGSNFGKNYDVKFEIVDGTDYDWVNYVQLYCEIYGSDGMFNPGMLETYNPYYDEITDCINPNQLVYKELKYRDYYDISGCEFFKDINKYLVYEIDYDNQTLRLKHINKVDNLFNGANGEEFYGGQSTTPRSGTKAILKGYRFLVKMTVTETETGMFNELYFRINS